MSASGPSFSGLVAGAPRDFTAERGITAKQIGSVLSRSRSCARQNGCAASMACRWHSASASLPPGWRTNPPTRSWSRWACTCGEG